LICAARQGQSQRFRVILQCQCRSLLSFIGSCRGRMIMEMGSDQQYADALAGRICVAASLSAQADSQLIELVGEFDAIGAMRWWTDMKSLAHWLSWSCSMSPGAAREHVRVARALRRMPTVAAAFREGRLSYSKVREATRAVDVLDDARLCELAMAATASQLARMIAGFRSANGMRIQQQPKRVLSWQEREDGMVDVRARLPKEEAAIVLATLAAAKDQFGTPPEKPAGDTTPPELIYSYADALLDVARGFLATAPEDRSGEDRTLVVVHVSAENLAAPEDENVPAGTSGDFPAGTPEATTDPTCHIAGVGSIEPETARRLACDADLVGAIVDRYGRALALGRTRRLVSRTQRRALLIRDRMCQFPACHQTRHLQAHHRVSWVDGGHTDLDNMILLCSWHHTAVHEGGMSIRPLPGPEVGWEFVMPDGTPHRDWYRPGYLPIQLVQYQERRVADLENVTSFRHPEARRIQPVGGGEGFDLHECVQALFSMRLPDQDQQAA
jgi:hypothetical protein